MTAHRLPLVGRLHSLRLSFDGVTFRLRVHRRLQGDVDYFCTSKRLDVLMAANNITEGQLVGIVAVSPSRHIPRTGLIVERLELLGRAVREAVA